MDNIKGLNSKMFEKMEVRSNLTDNTGNYINFKSTTPLKELNGKSIAQFK